MTDLTSAVRRGRPWRIAGVLVLVAAGAAAGYLIRPAAGVAPVHEPSGAARAVTPTAGWTPALAAHPAPISDAGTWRLPTPGGSDGPRSVTAAGVPFGYADTDDGALLAAVNAVIAGEWVTHTLATPWPALGFLASTQDTDPQRRANVAAFLGGVQPDIPTTTAPPSAAGGGCGCGFAVAGAAMAAGQPGADRGYRTVAVAAVWFHRAPRPELIVGVDQVVLHWEGDWRLADVSRQPPWFPTATAALPGGLPTVAPSWLS